MKKKNVKREVEKIIEVNKIVIENIKNYAVTYEFSDEDKKNTDVIIKHLNNMNHVFIEFGKS